LQFEASPGKEEKKKKKRVIISKIPNTKKASGVVQVVQCLPSNCETEFKTPPKKGRKRSDHSWALGS
jgi:hypothetical protein